LARAATIAATLSASLARLRPTMTRSRIIERSSQLGLKAKE
jgi:hypothetical protein